MAFSYFPYQPDHAKGLPNPAIQLFGLRFFADQTVSELLIEFLLIVFSPKRFDKGTVFSEALPAPGMLTDVPGVLEYAPKARLNLKLFSFLGASRLDSRHKTHREHHKDLLEQFEKHIHVADNGDKEFIIRTIENLFLGFQGVGSGRTWCAQSFLPISPAFLAGESIWNETIAAKEDLATWDDVIDGARIFFSMNKHRFLARGGELLYLQICNALGQPQAQIERWNNECKLGLNNNEQDPSWLHAELQKEFIQLMQECPAALTELADFIDSRIEPETSQKTDEKEGEPHFVTAGWCNREGWPEAYLFAVEILRLLKARLDVVDRIYLMELACAMHVLRSLAMQSTRALANNKRTYSLTYKLVVSAPEEENNVIRRLSQQSVKEIEKTIFCALRSDGIEVPEDEQKRNTDMKQADSSYGSKFFTSLAKRIGFVVPKRGSGARFVLHERLLRLLVITTIPLGGRLTFDTFKQRVEQRYGLVFDAEGLSKANRWLFDKELYLPMDADKWLQDMLEAAGFLIHLSDSCALIHNPADA